MSQFTPRQQDIIEAAIHIIAERGIQNLTIKKIGTALGVSEAALYRHFDSKLDILLAVLDSFENNADEVLRAFDRNDYCLAKLEHFILDRYRQFAINRDLSKVMFSEDLFQNEPKLAARMLAIMQKHKQKIVPCLEMGQANGSIRSDVHAVDLFRILIGPMRLTVTQWYLTGYDFDLEAEGRRVWQATRRLIEKPSSERE